MALQQSLQGIDTIINELPRVSVENKRVITTSNDYTLLGVLEVNVAANANGSKGPEGLIYVGSGNVDESVQKV